ncbi:hypothetical protein C7475_104123 [Chitinophaga sp. S165]|nr:hypothetical protein C7475_104123 [Chitinophaga sp. S165]
MVRAFLFTGKAYTERWFKQMIITLIKLMEIFHGKAYTNGITFAFIETETYRKK